MNDLEARERRLARARVASQIELTLGASAVLFAVVILMAPTPTFFEPMFSPRIALAGLEIGRLMIVAGSVTIFAAFAWMLWIQFHDTEAHLSPWLSHWR